MEPRIIKQKWQLEYVLGPDSVPIYFELHAIDARDARIKGERAMGKEWGKSNMSWRFIGAKTIEDA